MAPALAAGLLLAAVSALGTWLTLRYARRRRLLDLPGERRSHTVPTPRGGGLGITLACLAGCTWAAAVGILPVGAALAAGLGLALVAGIGWIDDHRPLSPLSRLLVQCLAGAALALGILDLQGGWAWALAAALAVPVLVNVWNFMDGIDGLATTQAMIALACFALLAPAPLDVVGWGAFGACCGFLPFNYPRARIFLGDVGSGTLGYLLAAVGVWAAMKGGGQGGRMGAQPWLLLLPLSAFLVDASLTLMSRIRRGEQWWLPHVSHLYQRLVRHCASHLRVSNAYGLFSLLAGWLAYVASASGTLCSIAVTGAWLLLATVAWVFAGRRLQDS